jgi:hypothetical protein
MSSFGSETAATRNKRGNHDIKVIILFDHSMLKDDSCQAFGPEEAGKPEGETRVRRYRHTTNCSTQYLLVRRLGGAPAWSGGRAAALGAAARAIRLQ